MHRMVTAFLGRQAMAKQNPDRDRWTAEQIARADYYTACMFLGSGRFEVRRAATLAGARQHREVMLVEYAGNYGRGVAIYAVGPAGSIHVE